MQVRAYCNLTLELRLTPALTEVPVPVAEPVLRRRPQLPMDLRALLDRHRMVEFVRQAPLRPLFRGQQRV